MPTFVQAGLSNAIVVVGLAIVVMLLAIRAKRPAWTHAMWVLVLLKLMLPPLFWVPIEYSVENGVGATKAVQVSQSKSKQTNVYRAGQGTSVSKSLIETSSSSAESADLLQRGSPSTQPAARTTDGHVASSFSAWQFTAQIVRTHFITMLLALWGAGVIVVLTKTVVQLRSFRRSLQTSLPVPSRIYRLLSEANHEIGLKRLPSVIVIADTTTPMVFAFGRRATLVLSESLLDQLDDRELSTLLAHELAHLRRGDQWVRLLELITSIIFWWHPVVRLAKRQLHRAEEAACDAWVTSLMPNDTDAYASAMLKIVDIISVNEPQRVTLGSAMGNVDDLLQRMRSVGLANTPHRIGNRGWLVIGLLAMLSCPIGLSGQANDGLQQSKSSGSVAIEPDQPAKNELTEARLLGFVRKADEKIVMWKPDGTLVNSIPFPAELDDRDTVAVFEIESDRNLKSHGDRGAWRSPKDNSIVFSRLNTGPGRRFRNVGITLQTPVRQEDFFSLTKNDVGKSVGVEKYGISKFFELTSIDDKSFRISVENEMGFNFARLVAVSQDGSLHMGKIGEAKFDVDSTVELIPITFPIPVAELIGLAVAELKDEVILFSSAAMHPGVPGSGRRVAINDKPTKLPAPEAHTRRFVLENDVVVDLVAVGRLTESGLEWWSPDGETEVRLDNVYEADVEGAGTVVAFRSTWDISGVFNARFSHLAQLWFLPLGPKAGGFAAVQEDDTGSLSLLLPGSAFETIESHIVDPNDHSITLQNSTFITSVDKRFVATAPRRSAFGFSPQPRDEIGFAVANQAGEIIHSTGTSCGGGVDVSTWRCSSVFPMPVQEIRKLLVVRYASSYLSINNISMQPGKKTELGSTVSDCLYPRK